MNPVWNDLLVSPSAWSGYWSTYETMKESRQSHFDEYSKQIQRLEQQLSLSQELPSPPTYVPPPVVPPTVVEEGKEEAPLIASSIW